MEHRETLIEGDQDSQATPPPRTGDDVPTSTIVATEAKTMAAVPFLFGGTAALIAAIIMVIFIVFR